MSKDLVMYNMHLAPTYQTGIIEFDISRRIPCCKFDSKKAYSHFSIIDSLVKHKQSPAKFGTVQKRLACY